MKRIAFLIALVVVPVTWATEELARYQIIMDRQPFGSVASLNAPAPIPSFSTKYQFVAIVNSNSGMGVIQAVIFDKDQNRSLFRAEGEMLDANVKLTKIQLQPPKVTIQSGLESAQLSFADRPNAPMAPVANAPGQPARPAVPTIPSGIPNQNPNPATPSVRRIPFRRSE